MTSSSTTNRWGERTYQVPLPDGDTLNLPSVTTILQVVAKPALLWWMRNVTATYAVENYDLVGKMIDTDGPEATIKHVTAEGPRHARKKADAGSAVHAIVDRLILGDPIVALEVDPKLERYVQGFIAFVDETGVTFTASEMTVFDPDIGYAGTLDAMSDNRVHDWKTRQGKNKRRMEAYETERLQLSAYAMAPYILGPDGTIYEKPQTDHAQVVMLCDDGYAVTEVDVEKEYEGFKAARALWQHLKGGG